MPTFAQGQLDAVLDVVTSTTVTGQEMLDALALTLAEASEAAEVCIFEMRPADRSAHDFACIVLDGSGEDEAEELFWDAYPDSVCSWTDPGSPWFGKHPADAPLVPERAYQTWRAYRAAPMTRTYGEEVGVGHSVIIPLGSEPGTTRRVRVYRPANDPTFTDRELTMLRLLQPHLDTTVGRALSGHTARERLSPRELEILAFVRGGRSTQEIASALWVSPSTVRKHLENVYGKLGVHSRTEAVAHVYGHSAPVGTPS